VWCKNKQLIVDFRKQRGAHHIHIDGPKWRGSRALNSSVSTLLRTYNGLLTPAQKCLFSLRRLKRVGTLHCENPDWLYHCLVWQLHLDLKALQRVMRTTQCITAVDLPAIQDVHARQYLGKPQHISKDSRHPRHGLFS
jgi:hypothetical protein